MDVPLGEHIRQLEVRVRTLAQELMETSRSLDDRNRLEAEIRVVNLALGHYRAAFELEKSLKPS